MSDDLRRRLARAERVSSWSDFARHEEDSPEELEAHRRWGREAFRPARVTGSLASLRPARPPAVGRQAAAPAARAGGGWQAAGVAGAAAAILTVGALVWRWWSRRARRQKAAERRGAEVPPLLTLGVRSVAD